MIKITNRQKIYTFILLYFFLFPFIGLTISFVNGQTEETDDVNDFVLHETIQSASNLPIKVGISSFDLVGETGETASMIRDAQGFYQSKIRIGSSADSQKLSYPSVKWSVTNLRRANNDGSTWIYGINEPNFVDSNLLIVDDETSVEFCTYWFAFDVIVETQASLPNFVDDSYWVSFVDQTDTYQGYYNYWDLTANHGYDLVEVLKGWVGPGTQKTFNGGTKIYAPLGGDGIWTDTIAGGVGGKDNRPSEWSEERTTFAWDVGWEDREDYKDFDVAEYETGGNHALDSNWYAVKVPRVTTREVQVKEVDYKLGLYLGVGLPHAVGEIITNEAGDTIANHTKTWISIGQVQLATDSYGGEITGFVEETHPEDTTPFGTNPTSGSILEGGRSSGASIQEQQDSTFATDNTFSNYKSNSLISIGEAGIGDSALNYHADTLLGSGSGISIIDITDDIAEFRDVSPVYNDQYAYTDYMTDSLIQLGGTLKPRFEPITQKVSFNTFTRKWENPAIGHGGWNIGVGPQKTSYPNLVGGQIRDVFTKQTVVFSMILAKEIDFSVGVGAAAGFGNEGSIPSSTKGLLDNPTLDTIVYNNSRPTGEEAGFGNFEWFDFGDIKTWIVWILIIVGAVAGVFVVIKISGSGGFSGLGSGGRNKIDIDIDSSGKTCPVCPPLDINKNPEYKRVLSENKKLRQSEENKKRFSLRN